jgi:hypothetical protein
MPTLTTSDKNLQKVKDNDLHFLMPDSLRYLEFKLVHKNKMVRNKHFKLSIVTTLFDKVSQRVLAVFKDNPEPMVTICFAKDIQHNLVSNDDLTFLITHNVTKDLNERYGIPHSAIEKVITDKLESFNYALYVDKKKPNNESIDLTLALTLPVDISQVSSSQNYDPSTHSWLSMDILDDIRSRMHFDHDTAVLFGSHKFMS